MGGAVGTPLFRGIPSCLAWARPPCAVRRRDRQSIAGKRVAGRCPQAGAEGGYRGAKRAGRVHQGRLVQGAVARCVGRLRSLSFPARQVRCLGGWRCPPWRRWSP
eukprot:1165936-Prymnesium_polylepis.1